MGILAALLMFAGLVFLAILVVPSLSAQVRCAAMFVLSASLALAGIISMRRSEGAFSQALLGCGMGSLFISTIVAYAYFGFMGDVVAVITLLAWLAGTVYLSRRYHATSLFVLAQTGMSLSVCFAYARGIEPAHLALVVLYQLSSAAVVTLGAAGVQRDEENGYTMRFASVMVCMGTALASAWILIGLSAPAHPSQALLTYAIAETAQFFAVTMLSAYLSALACKDARTRLGTYLVAECTWHIALWTVLMSALMQAALCLPTPRIPYTHVLGICALMVILHWFVRIAERRAGVINGEAERASVGVAAISCSMLLIARMAASGNDSTLPLLVVVACCLLLSARIGRCQLWTWVACVPLALDGALMAMGGYAALDKLAGIPIAPLYLVLSEAMLAVWWHLLPHNARQRAFGPTLVAGVVAFELSLDAALGDLMGRQTPLVAHVLAVSLVILVACLEPERHHELSRGVTMSLFANEMLVLSSSCVLLDMRAIPAAQRDAPLARTLSVVLLALVLACLVLRGIRLARRPQAATSLVQVCYGFVLTLWSTGVVWGALPARAWFAATVTAMLTALVCVILGFARQLKSLRLYGLVVTLGCVLGIVTMHASGNDPIGRVVSFIVGGLICFAISAVYTIAVRRLDGQRRDKTGQRHV